MRKKRIIHRMVYIFITAILMGNSTVRAMATSDVDYNDRFITISDSDLFTNMKGLLPGSIAENTVALNNRSGRSISFYLYAKPTEAEYDIELLKLIELTVSKGGTTIYRGPASGNPDDAALGQITENSLILDPAVSLYGINLGSVSAGGTMNLTASITVPTELGNEFQNAIAMVDWVFLAEGEDEPPTTTPDDDDDDDETTTTTLIQVFDEEIPLDAPDVIIEITDEDIPLDALPKTGSRVLYITEVSIILAVLVTGLIVIKRIEKKRA